MRTCGMFVLPVLFLWLVSPEVSVAAEREAPYTAYVSVDDAVVQSGPGENFYPTARLQRSETVEVHRLDPGAWCAIRPPAGSFSYVNARNVTPAGDKFVRVNADRIPARVGSSLHDVRDAIHIYLKQNEPLEVLGTATDGQGETWLKISPPAGEFRWVQERFLSRNPPSRYDVQPTTAAMASSPATTLQPATGPVLLTAGGSGEWVAVDGSARVPAGGGYTNRSGGPELTSARTEGSGGLTGGALQWELDQIELALARVMSEPTERWNFGPLRLQTESLQDRNLNGVERSRVLTLLNKIDRFEDLRRRSAGMSMAREDLERRFRAPTPGLVAAPNTTSWRGLLPAPAPVSTPASVGATTGPALIGPAPPPVVPTVANGIEQTQFDAVGRLTQVASKRKNAPTFALMDSGRNVVAFVTPGPGVDLRTLVGQQIGVQGERGYIPEFQRLHVTAQRATVMR